MIRSQFWKATRISRVVQFLVLRELDIEAKCNTEGDALKIMAKFFRDGKWWVAWTDNVPGALTQGATLEEAGENLIDAVRMMREPVDFDSLPKAEYMNRM